ncbi:MAG: acetylxylan esterase [Planctomycetia bacterium]|nr:acetylxylan esterase [Planctomycetia bacterium]
MQASLFFRLWVLTFVAVGSGLLTMASRSSAHEPNYDEAKVPEYQLPDPLVCSDGSPVANADAWFNHRRPELLNLFKSQMFGQMPTANCARLRFEELTCVPDALHGKATRKEIRIYFNAPEPTPKVDVLLYLPNKAQGPVGAFLGLNFLGNENTSHEPDITAVAISDGARNEADGVERGLNARRWPYEQIIDRGYAVATAYYEELDPDGDDGFLNGVHTLFDAEYPDRNAGDYPATITAWAWGLSRILDFLLTQKELDPARIIVMGHSRLGKTSLWAGANDERFAAVISNDSGCGGSALSRREFGETVATINQVFPHWFCKNFKLYGDKVDSLPFDQHELIALIAPRPVLIASAEEDRWADPKGEFLSLLAADPVYKFLGSAGLGTVSEQPPVNTPCGQTLRYHIRTGKHDVTDYDWACFLDFADQIQVNRPLP